MEPLISIIIPSYNHAHLIGRALQTVIDQTYEKWEVIVVDNCSDDDTDKVVGSFNDNRIKLLKINNNGIIAASRNKGIEAAKGEWIAFLDSDDWWSDNKLYESKLFMDNYDVIYHPLKVVNSEGIQGRDNFTRQVQNDVIFDLLTNNNALANSSVIVKRELIEKVGGLDENRNLISVEDYDLWIRLSNITSKFKMIDKELGYYWIHAHSMSSVYLSAALEVIIKKHCRLVSKKICDSLLANAIYLSGRFFMINGDNMGAVNKFKRGISIGNIFQRFRSLAFLLYVELLR
jgi:glycosyltransferase involved in cell wall biosynthesis